MSLLVEPEVLATLPGDTRARVLDARFSLADASQGRSLYNEAHIPGALYVDLEQDLSGPVIVGKTGRHPLPEAFHFSKKLQSWGIDETTQVVVYDEGSHAMAARAWWLLRWMGLTRVCVLHTGLKGWLAEDRPVSAELPVITPTTFESEGGHMPVISADTITRSLAADAAMTLIDARAVERFNGQVEPIDPRAGHIPGALCHPFTDNMDQQGRFLPPPVLKETLEPLLRGDDRAVFYCGSGVTACHNLLAMEYAGLGTGVLYPGSWSEWVTDVNRPIAPR
ncbi:sulfurtransferase [Candidatus Sororendozoicomonas aggregata]|uniref:sulfurtransferase n=1 Tax=Candidatus Sororendozoicomonas aggregata TaxID=3073239 RepID=UPI002ED2C9EA